MGQTSATLTLRGRDDALELDADRLQGSWTEEQYLRLSAGTSRLLELIDGRIEVVTMPTDEHQTLLKWLVFHFVAAVEPHGGVVQFAPLRLNVAPGRYREPDLLLLRDAGDPRRRSQSWDGADLVVEIISPDDPERDTVDKRAEYAARGVLEYWLVDARAATVTVLALDNAAYREHGVFGAGTTATSALLPGVAIDVRALFAAIARPGA